MGNTTWNRKGEIFKRVHVQNGLLVVEEMKKERKIGILTGVNLKRIWIAIAALGVAVFGQNTWAQTELEVGPNHISAAQADEAPAENTINAADSGLETTPAFEGGSDEIPALFGVPITWPNILTLLVMTMTLGLISYSLIASGRKGWGWVTLVVAAGVIAFVIRILVAIFREMAGGHCPTDWDEG